MKLGQILVCCMANISNIILAQCWRMETSSRPFYDFIQMTIQQDVVIFNSWHLPFLIVAFSHFQKDETLESSHGCLLSNLCRLLNWKGPGTWPQFSKLFKRFLKIIALVYIYQLTKFGDLMSCGSKDIVKNAPCLMY